MKKSLFSPLVWIAASTLTFSGCQPYEQECHYCPVRSSPRGRQSCPCPYPGTVKEGRYYETSGICSIALPSRGLAGASETDVGIEGVVSIITWDSQGETQLTQMVPIPEDCRLNLCTLPDLKKRVLESLVTSFSLKQLKEVNPRSRIIRQELLQLPEKGYVLYAELEPGTHQSNKKEEKIAVALFYSHDTVVSITLSLPSPDQDLQAKALHAVKQFRREN